MSDSLKKPRKRYTVKDIQHIANRPRPHARRGTGKRSTLAAQVQNAQSKDHTSMTGEWAELSGIRHDCYGEVETVESHLIPRQSLTSKLAIGVFPRKRETIDLKFSQLDKTTGEMVEGTDRRIISQSDRTLLLEGKPQSSIGKRGVGFVRESNIRQGANTRKILRREIEELEQDQTVTLPPILPDEEL